MPERGDNPEGGAGRRPEGGPLDGGLPDAAARERFAGEWNANFAVAANAGSGKTTAISDRLAAMALAPGGAEALKRTAVVTYTNKAAAQIGERARAVLLRRLGEDGRDGLEALDGLERAFFGTIHRFCLMLARRHGRDLGIHLNPTVAESGDETLWEEFLEQDGMVFERLRTGQVDAFLRHAAIDEVFPLARDLGAAAAGRLAGRAPAGLPPGPDAAALAEIRGAAARKGPGAAALARNKAAVEAWVGALAGGVGAAGSGPAFLPFPRVKGTAAGIDRLAARLTAPLRGWLAEAGAVLAAELALRFQAWRFERGIQTYADQIEAALAVLRSPGTLERLRAEGWRVILDEAQDTDPDQFAVLVEIARPPGAELGTWPEGGGPPPRAGRFSMVGDAQQGIYSTRADIRNFLRHLEAFERGDGGELLRFGVTFRSPRAVVDLLNRTLPEAFGPGRDYNSGLPAGEGQPARLLQVPYEPLAAGPGNAEGFVRVLALGACGGWAGREDAGLAQEARRIAAALKAGGPEAVGAAAWGDVCVLAPRNDWLPVVRWEFERAGLRTALQARRGRSGDNPAYAWLSGLLTVVCDPDNGHEWAGVLREVFAVADDRIAVALREDDGSLRWEEPESYGAGDPVGGALAVLRPFVDRVEAEGEALDAFAGDLIRACGLREKARLADPQGGLEEELERLGARASELGLEGGGPRAWLADLRAGLEERRPFGRSAPDAINLLSCHSSKGLEWPVVIPVGLWKPLRTRSESGLRLTRGPGGREIPVYGPDGETQEGKESRRREQVRESVRLLYVTLTRARLGLVLPWGAGWGAGRGSTATGFADLWGARLDDLEVLGAEAPADGQSAAAHAGAGGGDPARPARGVAAAERMASEAAAVGGGGAAAPLPPLPARLLPHRLAASADRPREARHEAAPEEPAAAGDGADPVDYGIWWHETLEHAPWTGGEAPLAAHAARALETARARGFGARGAEEWARLLAGGAWAEMRSERWIRLAELAVFAPLGPEGWIDGVMDLVLHDPGAGEVRIVDWKTNRRRGEESDGALLGRLAREYRPQLEAYGRSAAGFFPGGRVRLFVYSTVAGAWSEIAAGGGG